MILTLLRIVLMSPLATRRSRRAALALTAALGVMLSGCGALTGSEDTQERSVVASFYPLAWVAEQVAGDDWTITNLTTPGGEPHDLELSIDASAAVADAALVVYLDGFQPAVDDAITTNAAGVTLDAADAATLRPVADDGSGDLDPHFWLDPLLMADLGDALAEELSALDPDGAAAYRSNAEDLRAELEALDGEYVDGLTDCARDTVVVSHDAFGYLARYGLDLEPIAGLSPGAEPTPATLAALSQVIEAKGVTTVFSERLASPALAETLASDLGVETGVLDPLEGLTNDTAGQDYLSLMGANLAALEEANGC